MKGKSYQKKIDTQKVYPCMACAWHSALSGSVYVHCGVFLGPPTAHWDPPINSTPVSRIGQMSEVLDSATPK